MNTEPMFYVTVNGHYHGRDGRPTLDRDYAATYSRGRAQEVARELACEIGHQTTIRSHLVNEATVRR